MGLASTNGTGVEQASLVVKGTFVATGQSGNAIAYNGPGQSSTGVAAVPAFKGAFNIALFGTFVATIQLECSFDGGTNWGVVSVDGSGTPAVYTTPMKLSPFENERAVLYRWNCTSWTSGTVNYRISQTAVAA